MRYANKVALVTGGASGIGRAIVDGLVAEGGKVAFTDIAADRGLAIQNELNAAGAQTLFIKSDATQEADVAGMVDQVVARWGRLDVAVNNVGNVGPADKVGWNIHESTLEAWHQTLALSLTSNFLAMKYEIIQMLKQGGGVIANTASLAGMRVTPNGTPAYTAGKAGVIHLTQYAAVRYARDNIRVNVVAPGATATPALKSQFSQDELNTMASEFQPMGRMLEPSELADAYLWVCSDQASGVTGHLIPVDGGWAAR